MYPILFRVGDFAVTSFGAMMFVAFLAAAWTFSIQLQRRGLPKEFAWDVLGWVAVGGIVGAKLYYLGLHWSDVLADPIGEFTNRAGLVWYGGFLGGIVAFHWQVKRKGLPLARTFDAVAPGLVLAQALGRVGCFLVGDDYGLPTEAWYGIAFPEGAPPSTAGYLRVAGAEIPPEVPNAQVLEVHPTQLYEAAAYFAIFALLWRRAGRETKPGRLFALYMIGAGTARFFIEFVRAKTDDIAFGITTSQLASLLVVAAGVWLWRWGTHQPDRGARGARTAAAGAST